MVDATELAEVLCTAALLVPLLLCRKGSGSGGGGGGNLTELPSKLSSCSRSWLRKREQSDTA